MKHVALLCAATKVEANACQRGLDDSGLSADFEVCLTGIGAVSAQNLQRRLGQTDLQKVRCIVSTGFAGASIPGLQVGHWILGRKVRTEGSAPIALHWNGIEANLRKTSLLWASAEVLSRRQVVSFAQEPQLLPTVVDMESFFLAQVATEHAIDFQIFRMLSDTPSEPLPEAIGRLASVATAVGAGEKLARVVEGSGMAVRRPVQFAKFLARGSRLPGLLRRGWETAAPLFVEESSS